MTQQQIEEWFRVPMMRPRILLEMFGVDPLERYAVHWLWLVSAQATGYEMAKAIADLCKAEHMPRPALLGRIKKAVAPVLEADAETLKALGLRQCSTATGLAREVARSVNDGSGPDA